MPSFDYDKYIQSVTQQTSERPTIEELELLKKLLLHPPVVKLLGYTLGRLLLTERLFISMELGTGAGVADAIKLQGNLAGYTRFVESLGQVVAGSDLEEEY